MDTDFMELFRKDVRGHLRVKRRGNGGNKEGRRDIVSPK
jgi:hypothetical protein